MAEESINIEQVVESLKTLTNSHAKIVGVVKSVIEKVGDGDVDKKKLKTFKVVNDVVSNYMEIVASTLSALSQAAPDGDIKKLLDENNLTADDIKYIVPHQANARIIDFASRKLKIPMDKFMVNIDRYGNTSSASIPMVLDEYAKAGNLEKGDLLLMTAFGGGLAHAACLIRW